MKGKFKAFNSQVLHTGRLQGLTTIYKTLRLLGIAAGAICILKLYPYSLGTMQPLLCDQRQGSCNPGFPFRLRTAPTKVQHRQKHRKRHRSLHSDPRALLKAPCHKETSFFSYPHYSQVNVFQFASGRITCLLKSDQLLEPQC